MGSGEMSSSERRRTKGSGLDGADQLIGAAGDDQIDVLVLARGVM